MKGFGGKFGVQSDRVDKTALSYEEEPEKVGTNYEKTRPEGKFYQLNHYIACESTNHRIFSTKLFPKLPGIIGKIFLIYLRDEPKAPPVSKYLQIKPPYYVHKMASM